MRRHMEELHLDLQSKAARLIRDQLADQFRSRSAVEEMGTLISDHLDKEYPAMDVMLDHNRLVLDEYADDETPMVRNMVTAQELVEDLKMTPAFMAYRNADSRTFGKALAYVEGTFRWLRANGWKVPRCGHRRIFDDRLLSPKPVIDSRKFGFSRSNDR